MRIRRITAIALFHLMVTVNAWGATINPGDFFISVAAPNDGAVMKITGEGDISIFATGLDGPVGLAFSSDGQLWVVERGSGEVTNITSGGDFTNREAHSWGFSPGALRNLLIDDSGRLLVANRNDGVVANVSMGVEALLAPIFAYGLSGTRDVFQTQTGNIYAVEEFSGEVTDITVGGDFSGVQAFAGGFTLPYALAESSDGNRLFLAEALSGTVYDITNGGTGATIFSSSLGIIDEIIFDGDGNFYAVQEYEGRIADITAGGPGTFTIFADGLGQYPQQMAIAPATIFACRYDINQDGNVNDNDIGFLADNLGRANCDRLDPCAADFTINGNVDGLDLYRLASSFGQGGC